MREDEIVEKIIETNRDVKWIRAEIAGIKENDKELERRVSAIEALHLPARTGIVSERQVSAGIGAGAGSIAALILRLLGG
ncbi:hypothetical protein Mpet_0035 [Methanolacinia petrolearia DSM 11571]|uniref:Uncharacterized protein n=1 Tax=Methanolacinia petrolearia (strain DSM 11571 / OCM 486 / SEBR 4847) TaxID=679926 RepID=E1RDD2_METP4|nr:hypothetical protein [Methanolacinia petrolearia]ADN34816.1 hypothetical protein Mpet_0035 [Methanolacinia petrolearia DSM 11571]